MAAFVSGGGSNLRAIAGFEGFTAAGELALVVASKGDCRGAEWARERGVDVVVWPREDGSVRQVACARCCCWRKLRRGGAARRGSQPPAPAPAAPPQRPPAGVPFRPCLR